MVYPRYVFLRMTGQPEVITLNDCSAVNLLATEDNIRRKVGGSDETRTRGFLRDILGWTHYQRLTFSAGAAKVAEKDCRNRSCG